MEKLKSFAVKQIKQEIKELENEQFKNIHLLNKLKNDNLIGYPKTEFEIRQENKDIRNRINYLLTQQKELLK